MHAGAYGAGLNVAALAGVGIGLLTATVHDVAGGLVPGPGWLGLVVAVLTALVVACARALTRFGGAPGGNPIADLRTE
ncbi:hypothetical protein P5P86_12480 [Nocardioides sp. BP30]|uniref:hypothetical protein n=1 Tax=Nocardioides sp. BP30 TaxID=3036374 RepID=UPI0024697AFE|nr:hypothetical protein [Nocardioides sp. BP30]WGL50780.1 hypothetical protein P5P86_12480 [Nocardioides sp. BP30]